MELKKDKGKELVYIDDVVIDVEAVIYHWRLYLLLARMFRAAKRKKIDTGGILPESIVCDLMVLAGLGNYRSFDLVFGGKEGARLWEIYGE
jgi:hypothetical protein